MDSLKQVLILNGPPNSGKDVAAEVMCGRLNNVYHREFKTKLFEMALVITGLTKGDWDYLYDRTRKDTSCEECFGRSPRQLLIDISEKMIKPQFGKMYFGEAAARSLNPGINIFSDGGFYEEVLPLIETCGAENVVIARIGREGCTFEGDSRNYLKEEDLPELLFCDVHNDMTPKYFDTIESIVKTFLHYNDNNEAWSKS